MPQYGRPARWVQASGGHGIRSAVTPGRDSSDRGPVVARKGLANGFDPDRGLWTAAGCVATVLLWALIVAACGHLIRG
jgi:threonine/homoserine/homoserine lactone efflux protein